MNSIKKKLTALIVAFGLLPVNCYAADTVGLENMAYEKTVYSSGSYASMFVDNYAVDGKENTAWASGENVKPDMPLTLADGEKAGIVVDLEETCLISKINVRTRRDLDQEYSRKGWSVYVSDNIYFTNAQLVGTKKTAGAFKEDLEITLDQPKIMRYIKIVSNTGIVLSEIEAYGYAYTNNGGFSQYDDLESSNESYILSYLGIIPQGTEYQPYNVLSRGEAVYNILKLLNVDAVSQVQYFDDVSSEHKYFKEISTACEMGIISQAKEFRPDDFVTQYEFLVMTIKSLGYNGTDEVDFSNATSVIKKANRLKLMYNTNFDGNAYVNKQNALYIMFNALNTPVSEIKYLENSSVGYETGKTLLENVYSVELKTGKITANNECNLYSMAPSKLGKVEIDKNEYIDESGLLYKYLGNSVKYAVDSNDDNKIIFGFPDFEENTVLKVNCKDLLSFTRNGASYADGDKTKTISFDIESVLKNKCYYADYSFSLNSFKVDDGYIEFIDNNGDGTYEVINIMQPTVVQIENVSTSDGFIITDISGNKYDYSDYDNIELYVDGALGNEKRFKLCKLALVYESNGKKNIFVRGYTNVVEDIASEITENKVSTSNGYSYEFSDYYINNNLKIKTGRQYNFYSADGVLFIARDDNISGDADKTGFILRMNGDKVFCGEVEFRIYTSDGLFGDYYIDRKTEIDGSKKDVKNIIENTDYYLKKIVKFTASDDNRITKMDTENYVAGSEPDSNMYQIDNVDSSCKKSTGGIWAGMQMRAAAKDDMPVFSIPAIEGEYVTEREYEKYYSMTQFKTIYNYNGKVINELDKFYCKDDLGYVEFAVTQKNIPVVSRKYVPCTKLSAPVITVDKIYNALNADEEQVYAIEGYNIQTKDRVTLYTAFGMQYAINAAQIIGDKKTDYYDSNYNFVRRNIDIPDEYLTDILQISRGAILRCELYGNNIVGLDIIDPMTDKTQTYFAWESGMGGMYANKMGMHANIVSISNGNIKYTIGQGDALVEYAEIANVFKIGKKSIERLKPDDLPSYLNSGQDIFMYFMLGKATALIFKEQ